MMILLRADFAETLSSEESGFQTIMAIDGEVYRNIDGRKTLRFSHRGRNYFLKTHAGVGWKEIFKNLAQLRLPVLSARTEWRALERLQSLGIETPTPVGYGYDGKNPARLRSFLITEDLGDTITLEDLCRQWKKSGRLSRRDILLKRTLLEKVAGIARQMHLNRINHRDLYLCHFRLERWNGHPPRDPQKMPVYVMDLHRAQLRRWMPSRWMIKDIASLYFSSMDLGLTSRDLYRFIKTYTQQPLRETLIVKFQFWRKVEARATKLYRKICHKHQPSLTSNLQGPRLLALTTEKKTMSGTKVNAPSDTAPPVIRLHGTSGCLAYLKFVRDPVGAMQEASTREWQLYVLDQRVPFSHSERLRILALGPEFNRMVLGSPEVFQSIPLTIPGPRHSAQRRVSKGLTAINGEIHQLERQIVLPQFHKKAVEASCNDIVKIVAEMLPTWPQGQPIDIGQRIRPIPLRVSSQILFGVKDPERAMRIGLLLENWVRANFSVPARLFPISLPLTAYRRVLQYAEALETEMSRLIRDRKGGAPQERDLVSLLIQSHSDWDNPAVLAHLVSQATTLFGASYETTVSTLIWTLFLLAQHPRIALELLEELDTVLHGSAPSIETLDQLNVLEAVIKESMRILPPVPYTIRAAGVRTELGGIQLQKGDRVILSHYVTHHMRELFDNPENFSPQRWFEIHPSQYEYLPFSAGPRFCVGYYFAMMTLKITLAMILQRFRLTVVPNARIDRRVQIVMRPKLGMPMTIHHQDRKFQTVPVRGNIHEMVTLPS
jgi:cytochrome P450